MVRMLSPEDAQRFTEADEATEPLLERLIDCLIAEYVFDWRRITLDDDGYAEGRSPNNIAILVLDEVPHFCTDIALAWQVFEQMRDPARVGVAIRNGFMERLYEDSEWWNTSAERAAEWLCRYALSALTDLP